MIHYILQTLVFQLLFLVIYDLFLKKETFFNLNRLYLLVTPVLSFILPLIKIEAIQQNIPQQYMLQLPTVLIGGTSEKNISSGTLDQISIQTGNLISVESILQSIWIIGMLLSLLYFCFKLYKIFKLERTGNRTKASGLSLILLPKTDTAFSFFNVVFLGEEISEENRRSILAHEEVHIYQKHSLDLLFFEFLRIVFWFNPLVYIFQNRITTLQEYIADARSTFKDDKKQYYQHLLSQVFQTDKISFINTFFNHSLIKKRIVMLQKSKSKKIFQLKYLLLLPVICGMLIYTSCSEETKTEEVSAVSESDSEVMTKINELAEAIMKKGNMTAEEEKALKFLTTEAEPGDKVYNSVQEYLDDTENQEGNAFPFSVIEKAPTYPDCQGLSNEEAKKCVSQKISTLIVSDFNTKIGDTLGLTGKQRINIMFKINTAGNIVDVKARAAHPELEEEAIRVVSNLPKMIPGENKGKKVNVLYSLPILFEIK